MTLVHLRYLLKVAFHVEDIVARSQQQKKKKISWQVVMGHGQETKNSLTQYQVVARIQLKKL